MLSMYIVEDGSIGEVRVHRSSGWPLLDNAAMEGVRDWTMIPASNAGKAVCTWVKTPIVFRLTDYTADELARATVTPQAVALARALLGQTDLYEGLDRYDRENVPAAAYYRRLFESMLDTVEWQAGVKKMASMLALEFAPAELLTLNEEFTKPELRKFLYLMPKLDPSIRTTKLRLGTVSECIGARTGDAISNKFGKEVFANGFPREAIERTPALVEAFTPFCTCIANREEKLRYIGSAAPCTVDPPPQW